VRPFVAEGRAGRPLAHWRCLDRPGQSSFSTLTPRRGPLYPGERSTSLPPSHPETSSMALSLPVLSTLGGLLRLRVHGYSCPKHSCDRSHSPFCRPTCCRNCGGALAGRSGAICSREPTLGGAGRLHWFSPSADSGFAEGARSVPGYACRSLIVGRHREDRPSRREPTGDRSSGGSVILGSTQAFARVNRDGNPVGGPRDRCDVQDLRLLVGVAGTYRSVYRGE